MAEMRKYIEGFLFQEGITLTKLARTLGYKSRTSLVRIMDGSTRSESVRDFERRMVEKYALSTEQEIALHDAVTVAIRGEDVFCANQEMWRFIHGDLQPAKAEEPVRIRSVGGDAGQDLFARWNEARDLRITLINCQYVRLYTAMARLLRDRDDVQVEHFILSNRNNGQTIHLINGLMPVLYEKGYQGYIRVIDSEETRSVPLGMAASDAMICRYRSLNGAVREELIVFHEPSEGVELSVSEGIGELARLGIRKEFYQPIKRTYFESVAFADYIQYSIDYAELERGRAIWKIKPDIGVDYIPGDIVVTAVREGPMPRDRDFDQVLDAMEEIYARRYRDSFSKRCPAHTILKKRAMQQFAQTGKTSDHFWGMRAYTPEERIRILTELLSQELQNPYVHLYFLKDDDIVRDIEIAYYEDLGILVLPSDTDYNLAAGHSEAMIAYPGMMRLFRDFFMEELVSKYTLPEQDSVAILRNLIAACERQKDS